MSRLLVFYSDLSWIAEGCGTNLCHSAQTPTLMAADSCKIILTQSSKLVVVQQATEFADERECDQKFKNSSASRSAQLAEGYDFGLVFPPCLRRETQEPQ